jgi:hypothetical protein
MHCVDLRTLGRYRVWNEAENRPANGWDDPWDLVIRGQGGFVAPWGGERLVACTRSSSTTQKLLEAIPEAVVVQDGSDGQNLVFPASDLEAVADLMYLRRRRARSEQYRRAKSEMMVERHIASKTHHSNKSRGRQAHEMDKAGSQAT